MPGDPFVQIHCHSEYSPLDALPTLAQLVERIQELDQDACNIMDHNGVAGHFQWQEVCTKAGIKPLFGSEAYFCDDRTVKAGRKGELYQHLSLMALDNEGLSNLWALSSLASIEGSHYGDGRCDWDLLERYNAGVITTSGCLGGIVTSYLNPEPRNGLYDPDRALQRISRLLDIFGDRFFLELHTFDDDNQRKVNEELVAIGREFSIPLMAVCDSHYLRPEDWQDHELLFALSLGKTYDDPSRFQYGEDQLSVRGSDDIRRRLSYLPESAVDEAISTTRMLADKASASISVERSMPVFFDSAETDRIRMREALEIGFRDRVEAHRPPEEWPKYRERLNYELEIIESGGFPGYFLTVWDIVKAVKDRGGLMGPSRGSAGASLVSYLLRITELDPVFFDLLFERFLDPGRKALPDVDMDFTHEDRDWVRNEYLVGKYGRYNVATIGALSGLKPRILLRDLGRVLRIPPPDIQAISQIISKMPDLEVAHVETKWADIYREFGPQLDPWIARYPRLFDLMDKLGEHIRHAATHGGGTVISKESLIGRLPLWFKSGEIRTQMDHKDVDKLGYVKMDILGLRTLSTLQRCREIIQERHPDRCPAPYLDWQYEYEKYYEDEAVYRSLWDGKNIGIFQLESAGLRQVVKKFKPLTLMDVCDLVSVYRPGITRTVDPETGLNFLDLFLERRSGLRDPVYKHPDLEPILKRTYGQFLYQEQLMLAARYLAGYDLTAIDRFRKILGKKEVDEMVKERAIFVDGCKTNGITEELALSIFSEMQEFGKYGFNVPHGLAYAMIAYWCTWMCHYFPREWYTALFQTNDDEAPLYARECQRLGIPLMGPDINESGETFTLTPGGVIRYGLAGVKFVANAATLIRQGQPYTSVQDFYDRVPRAKVTSKVVKSLCAVGAFDSLLTTEDIRGNPSWWNQSQIAYYQYCKARGDKESRTLDDECESESCQGHSKFEHACMALKINDRAEAEREYLGSSISTDPLGKYMHLISTVETFISEDDMYPGEICRLGGIVTRINPLVTKRGANPGSPMCQMWVELPVVHANESTSDKAADDQVQIVAFPDSYEKYKHLIETGAPILADVRRLDNGGVCLVSMIRLDTL